MQTVNEIMAEELDGIGLDADQLGDTSQAVVAALAPVLDSVIAPLDRDPEALRVTEMYAAGLDAQAGA